MKKKVYLLTEKRYESPETINEFVENILTEDDLLGKALSKRGIESKRIGWDSDIQELSPGDVAILRTTWNYFEELDKFVTWLNNIPEEVIIVNPLSLIKWNINKRYLFELKSNGINIPDTLLIEKGTNTNLAFLAEQQGWKKIVIKPVIAAGAFNTYKLEGSDIKNFNSEFNSLLEDADYLLQEFQHNIIDIGEVSLVYIHGQYSHSIIKKAKIGDYRVQDDFGGTVESYESSEEQINIGIEAIKACPERPVYARIDLILSNHDRWVVSEVELIEPELWLRFNPASAELFAQAIEHYAFAESSSPS